MNVSTILQCPTAVFEGLRWDEDEDRQSRGRRCCCDLPQKAYHSEGSERPTFPAQAYLVFVNDERIAYNWCWEKADPEDFQLLQNHAQRFLERLL